MEENNVWDIVALPEGSKWVDVSGCIRPNVTQKAILNDIMGRLVAKGFI